MVRKRRVKRYQTFINDDDGFSAKDYLLVVSTSMFFLFVAVALILVLLNNKIDMMYLLLLEMVAPVVMTVVVGVMGVNAVESFRKPKETKVDETIDYGDGGI